ncbi:MAG: hypothetical protein FWF56_03535 [Firmicutes bacterium]|nr:hypothetical protein [Bacillota bacterium]
MNHYRLKKEAEKELFNILDSCGFANGTKITNESEVIASDKPLYYLIEPFSSADIANFDGVTLYATLSMSSANKAEQDDSSTFFQASYDLTLTMRENKQGVSEIIDELVEDLLLLLQDSGWQYSFAREERIPTSKTAEKLNQLVYTVDKMLYKAMSSQDILFPIRIAQGGTGASNLDDARKALGILDTVDMISKDGARVVQKEKEIG